jgi:hypothetical protein
MVDGRGQAYEILFAACHQLNRRHVPRVFDDRRVLIVVVILTCGMH